MARYRTVNPVHVRLRRRAVCAARRERAVQDGGDTAAHQRRYQRGDAARVLCECVRRDCFPGRVGYCVCRGISGIYGPRRGAGRDGQLSGGQMARALEVDDIRVRRLRRRRAGGPALCSGRFPGLTVPARERGRHDRAAGTGDPQAGLPLRTARVFRELAG